MAEYTIVASQTRTRLLIFFKENLSDYDYILFLERVKISDLIVAANVLWIFIKNDINNVIVFSRKICVNSLQNSDEEECYLVEVYTEKELKTIFVMQTSSILKLSSASCQYKYVLLSDVTIYGVNEHIIQVFHNVIDEYSTLWTDHDNIVCISENKYMSISLMKNWQTSTANLNRKIYSLEFKNCDLINKKFNKLHNQEKMHWTSRATSFEYSVFVVWKMIIKEEQKVCKRCVIVDI